MKSEETKRKIIEGSKKLFQLYGFTRISVDEIAVNLKISKKTIYKHFKSKDELIWGVAESVIEPFSSSIKALMESDRDFPEILASIFGLFQSLTLQVTPPMVQDMRNMPHIWEKIDARRRQMISSSFNRMIERGQKNGDVRKDLDPGFMTGLWLHLVSSMVTPQAILEYNLSPREFIEKLISIILTGVLTEKGRKKIGGKK